MTQLLEKKTQEDQEKSEGLEKYKEEERKWQEEKEQFKTTIEDLRRHHGEAERKIKVLHDQQAESNARYDHMVNEMKSEGNGTLKKKKRKKRKKEKKKNQERKKKKNND